MFEFTFEIVEEQREPLTRQELDRIEEENAELFEHLWSTL